MKLPVVLLAGWAIWGVLNLASASEPQTLPTVAACFTDKQGDARYPVVLETAQTASERRTGLMWREELAEDTGMLFSYPAERSPESGFWMYNTLIPLDIAFLDDEGGIVSIHQMKPCPASNPRKCPSYPAGKFFWHAVEMNAGYFDQHDLKIGDRLQWPVTRQQCER